MPKLPTTRLLDSRSRCRPMPTRIDKFIDNPAHIQTMALTQTAQEAPNDSTVAFWRSNSRIRDSQVAPVVADVQAEPFDGVPVMSNPTNRRHITDNLQTHAPPLPGAGQEYILEPEKFAYGFVEPPKYRLVSQQPAAGTLQPPALKQQQALQEKLGQLAKKQLHGDNSKETRLKHKMRVEYRRGALGVESIVSEGSEIYREMQREVSDKEWHVRQNGEEKMKTLLNNLSRVQYQKYDPIKDGDEAGPYTGPDKWFQVKGRVPGFSSFTQSTKTHDIRPVDPSRTQMLRNSITKGRQYDIVSGAQIEAIPPSVAETSEARSLRASHPSLNQREGSSFRVIG